MPKILDALKQGISEASSTIKEKGLSGWVRDKSAETGKMFGDAALELAAKELDLNSEEIEQLKNLKDNAEAIKQLKEQLGDVDLKDVDPEVVKRNLEYLSKTDLSKTSLGSETAKEVIQEPIEEQITETVKQEAPKSVQTVTQTAQTTIPEVAKKYDFFDFNKNGHISDDLLKIGLGVGAAAALGYGVHKLYKHFKNKKKDMSEFAIPIAAGVGALGSLALINHLRNKNEEEEFAREFYGPKEFRRRKKSEKVFNKFSPKIDDVYSKAGASKLSNGVYMFDVPGYPKLKEYHKFIPTDVRKDSSKPLKYDFRYESIVEPSPEESKKDELKWNDILNKQYNRKDVYKYNSDYLDAIADDQFMKYKAKKYGMKYNDMINLQNTVVDMSEQSLGKLVAYSII